MSSPLDRWPSEISGDTLPPSSVEIQVIESVIESWRIYGGGTPDNQIWQEFCIPVLSAAKNPDIRHLRGLIKDGRFPSTCVAAGPLSYMPWQSALNCAIEWRLPAHARLLVETGAKVDGFPLWCFSRAASRFVRGRPQEYTLAAQVNLDKIQQTLSLPAIVSSIPTQLQLGPTPSEITSRQASRSRFWAEADFPRLDFPAIGPTSSLAVAAKAGDQDTYGFLALHGADESAWREQVHDLSEPLSTSILAVQSPLHVSVDNQDTSMLKFLLDRQHKPDIFPVSTPTRGLSPLMLSLTCNVPWREGFKLMLPNADTELRTAVFGIHLLHLAVATLDESLIEEIQAARTAGADLYVAPSALGHSVLHVACLPLDNTYVNMAAEAVAASAREFRILAAEWKTQGFRSRTDGRSSLRASRRGRNPSRRPEAVSRAGRPPSSTNEAKRQAAMIRYLLQRASDAKAELARPDVHGNTPLHYLAMMRDVDIYLDLICDLLRLARGDGGAERGPGDLLLGPQGDRSQTSNEDVWTESKNNWGYTPQQVYRSNVEAGNEQGKDYNMIPFWHDELRWDDGGFSYVG